MVTIASVGTAGTVAFSKLIIAVIVMPSISPVLSPCTLACTETALLSPSNDEPNE